jgi:hypothetical protein
MKRIGFLSFDHWSDSPASQTRSDVLLQSIGAAMHGPLGGRMPHWKDRSFGDRTGRRRWMTPSARGPVDAGSRTDA